jgi:hypothetical protein
MITVCTPHDPLRTACLRQAWINLVKRAAAGTPCFRDDWWLADTMKGLGLTAIDFASDTEAMKRGDLADAPRMRGEWPQEPPFDMEDVADEGFVVIDN